MVKSSADAFVSDITFSKNPLDIRVNKYLKRLFDLAFSIIVIVFLLSWLIPILAIFIKISSNGPVFFSQLRTGYNNDTFNCLKLRSMSVNPEADTKQASTYDNRVTFAGRFLRKYSLDELPQFFNVFMGSMSVIGPRPHMLSHTKTFTDEVHSYNKRHNVKPGITGLAQVLGFRGEITDNRAIRHRVRLDLFYIKKWSIALDVFIIYKTVKLLIFGDTNAY